MESHHKYEFVIKCPTKYYLREISISLLRYFHTPEYAWAYTDSENNTITIEISEYRYSRVCELLVSAEKNRMLKANEEAMTWLKKHMEQDAFPYECAYMEDHMKEIIVRDLWNAWNGLDAELIIRHLAPEFRFKSMWVNESLDRDRYAKYIREQFDEIRQSGSQLGIREVPGHDALAIAKNGYEPAYYIAKITNGAIVKVDWTRFLM